MRIPLKPSNDETEQSSELEPLLPELSLDEVVNQIGTGKFHYRIFFLFYLCSIQQTSQCSIPGVIVPSLKNEFGLSKSELSMFGTFEYLGFLFASVVLGRFSNNLGRRKGIIVSYITWFIFCGLTMFSPNIYVFSILRCCVSTSFMLCLFCMFSLVSEICPQKIRGLILNSLIVTVVSGFMSVALFGKILIPDIENSDWRPLILMYSILLFFSIFINIWLLEESPRYDLFLGDKARGFQTITKMARLNLGQQDYLTERKKEQIEMWVHNFNKKVDNVLEDHKKESGFVYEYKKLFKGAYKQITLTMFLIWSVTACDLFGMEFVLPTTLSKLLENYDYHPLTVLFYLNASILPFLPFFLIMVEMKYFGRKKTLILIYFSIGIGGFFTYFEMFPGTFFWLWLYKISVHFSFVLIYLFNAELYPTQLRTNAIGQSSAFSRVSSMIIIWVAVFLVEIQTFLPFLIYGIFGFAACFAIYKLPYETLNEDLDRVIK